VRLNNNSILKKIILIIAGNISLALGIVGIFVPLLPTTPFLLLSATCFLRSSKRLYNWLTHHKLFGTYIRSYLKYRAISLKAKVLSILLLWIVISTTVFFFINLVWLRVLLVLIAVGVTVHILSLRTLTLEMLKDLKMNQAANLKDKLKIKKSRKLSE